MHKSMTLSQLPPMAGEGKAIKPVLITTQYGFTPTNMPKVPCHFHPNEIITYFCKETRMPLCPICVQEYHHEQQATGKRTNIVPLEACLTEVYSNVSKDANDLVNNFERLRDTNEGQMFQTIGDRAALLTNPIQLIESARNQVHSIVDNYFNTLITFIRARVPEGTPHKPDVNYAIQDLKQRWDQIIHDLEVLNTQQCLSQLIHFYNGDLTRENDRVYNVAQQALRDLEDYVINIPKGTDIPQLHVDPLYLQKFLWALERYAYFFEPPFEEPPQFIQHSPPPMHYNQFYPPALPPAFISPPPIIYPPHYDQDLRQTIPPRNNYREEPLQYREREEPRYVQYQEEPRYVQVNDNMVKKSSKKRKEKKDKTPKIIMTRYTDNPNVEKSRTQMVPVQQTAIPTRPVYSTRPSQNYTNAPLGNIAYR